MDSNFYNSAKLFCASVVLGTPIHTISEGRQLLDFTTHENKEKEEVIVLTKQEFQEWVDNHKESRLQDFKDEVPEFLIQYVDWDAVLNDLVDSEYSDDYEAFNQEYCTNFADIIHIDDEEFLIFRK